MNQRTRIRRHPERAVPNEWQDILARGMVAHLGFVQDGQPFVIPFAYHYDPAQPHRLYLHGSVKSRAVRHLASGAPVCVTVTLVDGLVYSRDAQYHSMNYRSVVCFGQARPITDRVEKEVVLERMTRRYFPGRTLGRDYAPPYPAQMRGTAVLEVRIEEWSAKARRGGPRGPRDGDPGAMGTCGVVELTGHNGDAP
ncbi:MAG: pyridoxamine 5'-phosphate oxidase family protein [Dehalococcoidia bacterium]